MRFPKRSLLMMPPLLAAATTAANSPKVEVQCVLVENAQIAGGPLDFGSANYGHQIITGTRSVLAIRIFDDPDEGIDSAGFAKATLEFDNLPVITAGKAISVGVLNSYYAKGSSAFASRGNYWWAEAPFVHVGFRSDGKGLHATLRQDVHATYAAKTSRRPPRSIPVNVTCPVRKVAVKQLTAWTGRVGTAWNSFNP
jgi:hypothetical protein